MRIPHLSAFLLALLFFVACDEEKVEIRLYNQTGVDWQSAYVDSNGNEQTYSSLPDGERSPYLTYPAAYRYGFVRAITIAGDTLLVVPIDYVGEPPLGAGKYTYRLTRNSPDQPWMGLELE